MNTPLKRLARLTAIALLTAAAVIGTPAQQNFFSDWPAGSSPQEIGKRVAENFVVRRQEGRAVHYKEVCAWYGSLEFAQLTKDTNLLVRLVAKFEPLLTTGTNSLPPRSHVDDHVFGTVPFEIYLQNQDPRCLELGKRYADAQWEKTTPDGITTEARYWVDDMFMITAVQVQAFRATHETNYLDRAALTMATYLDRLQTTNGLFFHTTNNPFYWSRGNGWFAAGMAEMLRSLPENHPQRARILKGYQTMLAALLKYQGDDGTWRQLIDHPESWTETSGTAMFTFAMVTGVKNGWLDAKTFGPAARKAWLGLVSYLDENANLKNVCEGTGASSPIEYYLNRRRLTGDLHGQAPLLWTADALLR